MGLAANSAQQISLSGLKNGTYGRGDRREPERQQRQSELRGARLFGRVWVLNGPGKVGWTANTSSKETPSPCAAVGLPGRLFYSAFCLCRMA